MRHFKTGEELRWRASQSPHEMTAEERETARKALAAEQAARGAHRRHREAVVSHTVTAVWNQATPVHTHPYLTCKRVEAWKRMYLGHFLAVVNTY